METRQKVDNLFVGDKYIVHLSTNPEDMLTLLQAWNSNRNIFFEGGEHFKKAFIRKDLLWMVAGTSSVYRNNERDEFFHPRGSGRTAELALNMFIEANNKPVKYSLKFANCEHFATWCRYGTSSSDQVKKSQTVVDLIAVAFVAFVSAKVANYWKGK